MGKFFRGCLIFFIGMFIGVIALIVSCVIILTHTVSKTKVSAAKNTFLMIDYDGDIKECPTSDIDKLISRSTQQLQLLDYIQAIKAAANDPNIIGIIINADKTFYARSHTEELSVALKEFSGHQKPIYAWLSNGDNSNYAMALNADKIYMPATVSASLTLHGYNITSPYFKGTLDKIGVKAEVIHIGDYKGTGENYVRQSMSEQLKSNYLKVFDEIHNEFISNVAAARHLSADFIKEQMQSGETTLMTPFYAKSAGFIDDLMSLDDIKRDIIGKNKSISIADYTETVKKSSSLNKIAVIYAEGTIVQGKSNSSSTRESVIGDRTFCNDIAEISSDNSIKAVVLRINSPGGSALASELMLKELNKLKKIKPVYVSFGPMAASGGYYISCIPDVKVWTTKNTITGSIGVLSMMFDIQQLSEKIGVNFETLKKYKYDDMFSSSRHITEDEKKLLQKSMSQTYSEFTAHVTESRGISVDMIDKIAQGRIWTGTQALKVGLAHEIGGLSDTIDAAAKNAKLSGYSIVSYPAPSSIIDEFLNGESSIYSPVSDILRDTTPAASRMLRYYMLNKNEISVYEPYIEAVR